MSSSIEDMKEKLNSVGRGFCLAKWLQVTVHLQTGHTHSCHHPITHKIPLSELEKDPSALHNTEYKKNQRKAMLEGKRPSECEYCWRIEDLPGNQTSDRHLKSNDEWAAPYFQEVLDAGPIKNINPKYLEVSFSNKCNFKCAYCNPVVSSKWMSEIKQHGPYPTHNPFNSIEGYQHLNKMPIEDEDENPYVRAFWQWMPDLYKDLRVFRVTGGEPLLAKSTFKLLDFIEQNPNPNLELGINSNLGVPKSIVVDFTTRLNSLIAKGAVKKAYVYTSLDTFGKQAEVIRDGLNMEIFQENLSYLLENSKKLIVTFMTTFNVFSLPKFSEYINFVYELKKSQKDRNAGNYVFVDISYLSHPQFLSCKLAPQNMIGKYLDPVLGFMKERSSLKIGNEEGFHEFEVIKMARLIEYMNKPMDENEIKWQRIDLKFFMDEYEKRRGFSFEKTYPEMISFFNEIKSSYAQWQLDNPHSIWPGEYLRMNRPSN
ncbi:MAG: twitch domain-containing radical SAM protein [Proteobacteria bacterium]|jgi:organic radical activating enzyme|nr:twitch domain-containing radical SAM protein [Pseudomonadota bacterium]